MMTDQPTPFDVCGPLPTGTVVLEASAGTGKTHTIAALAARYLAEGHVELSQLMLVTFGRMATNELRLRVRDRLVSLEAALTVAIDTGAAEPHDSVEALLLDVSTTELALRQRRIARALADYDAATIATTHEFCLRMLDGLGVLGDREPQGTFVEHLADLTREVATDLYLARYATSGQGPFGYSEALNVAGDAVQAVHARLVPDVVDPHEVPDPAERVAFAAAVRAEVDRRKRSGRLFTYDDMLTRLRDALADPQHGQAAATRLRNRYRVVMVDEFQDTDPIQWEIVRRAFAGHGTVILIGDPKQAIYAFRGADVYSYLDAVRQADQVRTLDVNWRSDQALVDGLESLIGGTALGDEQIMVRPVMADHQGRRLRSPSDAEADRSWLAPLRLRVLPHDPEADHLPAVADIRPQIADDLAADISALLASDATVDRGCGPQQIQPADIGILVRTNARGEALRDRLIANGIPAVMHGASSIFSSDVARDWLTLLLALEQPRQATVRQAALTCFFGWTFADLAQASESEMVDLTQRVRWWSRILSGRGVAALLEAATAESGVPERLLAHRGGERRLTDLRHLAQVLHAARTSRQLGVGALVEWLRSRMAEARGNGSDDETRRLETDAKAVTILTVHRSKGLQFPVVYLPEIWDRHVTSVDEGRTLRLHEPSRNGGLDCVLDVGGKYAPGRSARFDRFRAEEAGEDLRLAYVALTRAQCQVVTWWAASHNTPASALQRLLRHAPEDPAEPLPAYPMPDGPFAARPLGPEVSIEPVSQRLVPDQPVDPAGSRELAARAFTRTLDLEWRRTSYSALTAATHGMATQPPGVSSEPEGTKEDDESAVVSGRPEPPGPLGEDPLAAPSPMAGLPLGAAFGTTVHSVLELTDRDAPDLPSEVRRACAVALGRSPDSSMTVEDLTTGLLPVFDTPLGPLAGDRTLREVPMADQLAELTFEYALAGGDATTAEISVGMLAPLLRRYLPATDPLVGYAAQLEEPGLAEQALRGFLTGSIDAVLRVPTQGGDPRYLIVDYKTNWLGAMDGPVLTLGDYLPDRLTAAMAAAHYPLQALLYAVALHRLLRWRQPGYNPEAHLGGVLYLFVRGMAGPTTPRVAGVPCGVFSWRPPNGLVPELSDLLDGVTR